MGCEDGITPHADNPDKAEERRLFYVAMTRAEDNLWMSYTLEDGAKPSVYLMDCGKVQQKGIAA